MKDESMGERTRESGREIGIPLARKRGGGGERKLDVPSVTREKTRKQAHDREYGRLSVEKAPTATSRL